MVLPSFSGCTEGAAFISDLEINMDVYLNGKMIPPEKALIGHDDAGIQHGVGLFETMFAQNGRAFRLQQHLERLAASSAQLGLTRELDIESLAQAVDKTLKHNKIERARLRLTLTPGRVSLLRPKAGDKHDIEPTVLIVASEPMGFDDAYFKQGIMVQIAPPCANPFDPMSGHKTLNYWPRLRTLRQAAAVGAGEAIWLNISNHLASGAVSNIFIIKGGSLFTPFARGEEVQGALPAPVLPGVTRQAVIEIAQAMNIPFQKQMLTVNDLLEADEVFLTNSGWQLLPVSKVEKKVIGKGEAGEMSLRLREALLAMIEKETSAPDHAKA